MSFKKLTALLLAVLLLLLAACAQKPEPAPAPEEPPAKAEPAPLPEPEPEPEPLPEPEPEPEPEPPQTIPAYASVPAVLLAEPSADAAVLAELAARDTVEVLTWSEPYAEVLLGGESAYAETALLREITEDWNGYIVAIDAGHQLQGNFEMEPIGPGASETKIKVSSGTTGISTGIPEYELTLALSLKLQTILEARGYHVIMTRTTHEVDISNIERAAVANEAKADAFIRVHANGSTDTSVSGALTICQTPENPYNGDIYEPCYAFSAAMLDALVETTGCERGYVWETDTMCGINWCEIPVTIAEVGYMSNPAEDELLATEEYRDLVALGMANGIDAFLLGDSAQTP